MAYGNYGAMVFKNKERMRQWEDQTPYKEEEIEAGYQQAFGRQETKLSPHHAVLGEGPVRLCGYKTMPILMKDGKVVDLIPYAKKCGLTISKFQDDGEEYIDDDYYDLEGEIDGYNFEIKADDHLHLKLVCPNGDVWIGEVGYCWGSGWED